MIFHLDAVSQIRFKEAILNRTCIENGKEYSLGKEAIKYLLGERDSITQIQYVKFTSTVSDTIKYSINANAAAGNYSTKSYSFELMLVSSLIVVLKEKVYKIKLFSSPDGSIHYYSQDYFYRGWCSPSKPASKPVSAAGWCYHHRRSVSKGVQ